MAKTKPGAARPRGQPAPPGDTHIAAVGARLRGMREVMELSQAEVARRMGVTPQCWHNYEKGLRYIEIESALKLVRAFPGVSLDFIYRGDVGSLPSRLASALARRHYT